MAEAIELNFPNENNKSSKELNTLVEDTARELAKEIDQKTTTDHLSQYHIDNYYNGDTLGADVLKNKYLAPWESHPYELWKRQASALASVEKTKKSRMTSPLSEIPLPVQGDKLDIDADHRRSPKEPKHSPNDRE